MDNVEVEVSFDAFLVAASKIPKSFRAPAGSRAEIPKDTELLADDEGILVNTPVMGTLVRTNDLWKYNVSVDARKLVNLLQYVSSIGAKGNNIYISVNNRDFWIRLNKTRCLLNTVWRKPDKGSWVSSAAKTST